MNENMTLLLLQGLFIVILLSPILYQRFKRKVKPLKWIIIVLLLALLRTILEIVFNPDRENWDPWKSIHIIAFAALILALYHYGELAIRDKPHPKRLAIAYTLAGLLLGFFIMGTILDMSREQNPAGWPFSKSNTPFWELPFDILSLLIWLFMIYVFGRMAIFSENKKSKILSVALLSSMILFFIVSLIELSEHFTGNEISASLTTIPAFILLIGVYTYNPRFAYSSPVKLHRLILLHEDGPTLVQEILSEKYHDDTDSGVLLGSITTSINALFQEITRSTGDIARMESDTTTMLFAKAPQIIAVLEVDRSTKLLNSALLDFAKDFAKTYEKELSEFGGDLSLFKEYKSIFTTYFPFLE